MKIRTPIDNDREAFVEMAVKLGQFNRNNHSEECKKDDFNVVIDSLEKKAHDTFTNMNDDTLILIAELNEKPIGYVLGRIYEEDSTSDNGTGRIGLIDQLYLENSARGLGLGQKLIDESLAWMKERGINRVKLHAYSWNNHAKKLYEKNGFNEYAVSYEKFI
jgi:ribosomal protein S18 acetylase RimI-like enzyme